MENMEELNMNNVKEEDLAQVAGGESVFTSDGGDGHKYEPGDTFWEMVAPMSDWAYVITGYYYDKYTARAYQYDWRTYTWVKYIPYVGVDDAFLEEMGPYVGKDKTPWRPGM